MKTILLSAVCLLGLSVGATAQATATATANATVIAPITISNTANLNFGNIAVSATTGGTVVVVPAGTRSKTGGVTLTPGGTVGAATFTVNGSSGLTYSITLPSSAITLTGSVTGTMTADVFTSNPSATGTLTGGTSALSVGATLNVAAAQAPGTYTSATFDVTVNYN